MVTEHDVPRETELAALLANAANSEDVAVAVSLVAALRAKGVTRPKYDLASPYGHRAFPCAAETEDAE